MSITERTAMSNDPRDVYGSDAPIQPEYHREKMRAERIANGLDPDTGRFPDSTEHILDNTLDRLNIPGATILRIPRPAQAKMQPESLDNVAVHKLQMAEARDVDVVAEQIADTAYGVTHFTELHRIQQHECRCVAMHALRRLKPSWVIAAQEAAVEAGVLALKDAGITLKDERLYALSAHLVGHITTAYLSVTEGTATLTPAAYLRITQGER